MILGDKGKPSRNRHYLYHGMNLHDSDHNKDYVRHRFFKET